MTKTNFTIKHQNRHHPQQQDHHHHQPRSTYLDQALKTSKHRNFKLPCKGRLAEDPHKEHAATRGVAFAPAGAAGAGAPASTPT